MMNPVKKLKGIVFWRGLALVVFFGVVLPLGIQYLRDRVPPEKSVVHRQFNFHVTAPGVWRCAQPGRESLQVMKTHGLKSIVNLRHDPVPWEKALAEKLEVRYFSFPMSALEEQDPGYLEKILGVIENPENQPVLVHCHAGKDRTGLVSALYRLRHGAKLEDAIREMRMYGYDEKNYPLLMKALKTAAGSGGFKEERSQ